MPTLNQHQVTKQCISHTRLGFPRVVLIFLLAGFGFGIEDLVLGLGMGLRFGLY